MTKADILLALSQKINDRIDYDLAVFGNCFVDVQYDKNSNTLIKSITFVTKEKMENNNE